MKTSTGIMGKLNNQGYRLTPQRMMILSAIEESTDHISADEIFAQVSAKYPYVNIPTVYRTLELLKQLGLVSEVELKGRVRYHPATRGHHHHLVCEECGSIIELDESVLASLRNILLKEYRFVADLNHLAITGHCVNCRRQ